MILIEQYVIRNLLPNICFSGECSFFLNVNINKQNYRYWSDENLHIFWERKVYVLAAILKTVEIGTQVDAEGNLVFQENLLHFQQDNAQPRQYLPKYWNKKIQNLKFYSYSEWFRSGNSFVVNTISYYVNIEIARQIQHAERTGCPNKTGHRPYWKTNCQTDFRIKLLLIKRNRLKKVLSLLVDLYRAYQLWKNGKAAFLENFLSKLILYLFVIGNIVFPLLFMCWSFNKLI